ncbi:uncharacterized protein BCR38DRAFT_419902 [Pseudomassariella vexata]|uniref:Uncharacterized protein n=1 Tax=Pseudomassariella vexata TaxID=1141098 RepID=A0A1Y2EDS5_9PEZI|nr:uncharacterized protein BCR38DRAFT_419902 [Pseudomassariella vexata]ORY69722.1 hypothetical protein BCR38DRAFT_419902 [Pseudomassariella vexata]
MRPSREPTAKRFLFLQSPITTSPHAKAGHPPRHTPSSPLEEGCMPQRGSCNLASCQDRR